MKKIQTIGMRLAIAAVFATTLLVSVGSKSVISAARADDPGTGTGTTGWSNISATKNTYDANGKLISSVACNLCGSGSNSSCTPTC